MPLFLNRIELRGIRKNEFDGCTGRDVFTKEGPAIEIDLSLSSERAQTRGYPKMITVDNGPEVVSTVFDRWAFAHGVELHFIRPGSGLNTHTQKVSTDASETNALNQCQFPTLAWARRDRMWSIDSNEARPHSALGALAPRAFATTFMRALNSRIRQKVI